MLKIGIDALVMGFCSSSSVTITNLLHENRAEAATAPERKIVDAKVEDGTQRRIGQFHDAPQERLARGVHAQTSGQSRPSFAASGQSDAGNLLTVPDRHPSPGLHEVREPFRKDCALTERITTVEFAHGERKLDPATPTRNISQVPAIMTLDGRGCASTEWTARCRVRGTHRNQQTGFSHLDLINDHPFRERKQWRPFHDTLALSDETIFKRFLMEGTISLQPNLAL